jgi:hypothetical protein
METFHQYGIVLYGTYCIGYVPPPSLLMYIQLRPVKWYHFHATPKFATYRAGRKKTGRACM